MRKPAALRLFSSRRRLSYLYVREGWRRVSRRLSIGRVSTLRFTGSTPNRLIVAPTDLRAVDPFVAEEILAGRFPLAGRVLDTEGDSPFEIDLPSREFAARLHSFGWLRHLRAIREDAGYVRRDRKGGDRRKVHCVITPSGLALLDAMDTLVKEITDLVGNGLPGAGEQKTLIDLLARVRSGLKR